MPCLKFQHYCEVCLKSVMSIKCFDDEKFMCVVCLTAPGADIRSN